MPQKSIYWYICFFLILHVITIGIFYLVVGSYIAAGSLGKTNHIDLSGKPLGSDFLPYWAASKLALTGNPAAIFSREEIYAVEREVIGADFPPRVWPYPPTFLLMVLPLAFLAYPVAFLVWLSFTGLAYLQVIHRIIPKSMAFWIFIFFPGAVSNCLYGQNGFLSAVFFGGGLLLAESYPFAGGCLLGLLSYKPQLAFLIPLALVMGRYWKVLTGTAFSAITLALASLWGLGSSVWISFFKNLPTAAAVLNKAYLWGKMPTVFAAARLGGASQKLAAALQAISTIGIILVISWIWFRRAPLPIRGSVLAVGIFLATPFAFDYDLTILALPFAWLGWDAYTHELKFQETLLLLVCSLLAWTTLGPSWVLSWAYNFPFKLVVLLALLFLAVYRVSWPLSPTRRT
jgi:alpha-1,2-mannosyltransferase